MTYDWNKQVEITVPTGTNGWIYSGEVIINGVKVRFPVGVPTTVPEPAAALLNKMIELEREEENNTAKPDNHYVGSVTIPEGKTLTLAKGAKVVDEDGLLGSAPAPVVILPETVVTVNEGQGLILTPLSATPTDGATAKVTYNGTEYLCPVVAQADEEAAGYMLGNLDATGNGGGNPDAPFLVVLIPDGVDDTGDGTIAYGFIMTLDGATSVTLYIVQTGEASADGDDVSLESLGFVTVTATGDSLDVTSVDMTFEEVMAAATAGKWMRLVKEGLCLWYMGYDTNVVYFGGISGEMCVSAKYNADGLKFSAKVLS